MGGQSRCERRREVFVKIQKNIIIFFFFFWGGGLGRSGVGWGHGTCGQRSEVFVKILKQIFFWGVGGSGWGGGSGCM